MNASTSANALAGLTTNASGSALRFAGGADFTSSGAFTHHGTLALGDGSVFTAPTVSGAGAVTLGGLNARFILNGGSGSSALSGVVSGLGIFTKSGHSSLTLSGANTFEGEMILQGGTCRFSESEKDGVTSPRGNVHGFDNLYVTDGGALPSSGTAPSTMTIVANALRIADGIKT